MVLRKWDAVEVTAVAVDWTDTEDIVDVAAVRTVAATIAIVLGIVGLDIVMLDDNLEIILAFVGPIGANWFAPTTVALSFVAAVDILIMGGIMVQPFGTGGPSMSSRI